jgi:hypothetical protein
MGKRIRLIVCYNIHITFLNDQIWPHKSIGETGDRLQTLFLNEDFY